MKLVALVGPSNLGFLAETSTRLGLKRKYAYAPVAQRLYIELLRNFGSDRTQLLPSLTPNQVLVLDKYVVH